MNTKEPIQSASKTKFKPEHGFTPILRWAGSKKRSLAEIVPFLPKCSDRYLEVFAGSACLFFHVAPKRAVIADNNVELIRFYKTVAKHPENVFDTFSEIDRDPKTYYKVRSIWATERDLIKRAAYFLYLNRNCFNGIYRTNSNGFFNVPFASDRVAAYPLRETVLDAARLLRRANFQCADFESVCETVVRGDFVYLDPPYYIPARRVFREYSSLPFSEADFQRLRKTLHSIDKKGGKFLLSYPECSLALNLASEWSRRRITVRRTIAGNALSRRRAREILVFNYDPRHA